MLIYNYFKFRSSLLSFSFKYYLAIDTYSIFSKKGMCIRGIYSFYYSNISLFLKYFILLHKFEPSNLLLYCHICINNKFNNMQKLPILITINVLSLTILPELQTSKAVNNETQRTFYLQFFTNYCLLILILHISFCGILFFYFTYHLYSCRPQHISAVYRHGTGFCVPCPLDNSHS